ncbi:shikimate dehydrogenase [Legionella sp. MW5194]|uniref:shikimate dehydrogenase n=1 Tax=Legionella sp. MW5194 TaxID=2662448 RepID=UPI00193E7B0C|nr:shikimate dehydrogenase [Legionella sp. MW5194]QRN02651.1 shikimate dehydrogenase [Legionella sp. MW5194]
MVNRYAVMGHPVAHSLSPFIHEQFALQSGVSLSYEKIAVEPGYFVTAVQDFFAAQGKGLNVTLPFKEEAYQLAEQVTPRCRQARAANTLWMKEGHLHADNTDGIGLIRDLKTHMSLADKRVLILGAGGAARGIIAPLLAEGIGGLTVTNRNLHRAKDLQADFPSIHCQAWGSSAPFDLLINATSAGTRQEEITWPEGAIKAESFCYDLSYTLQGCTSFVTWARQRGCGASDGLGMLVEQAAEAFFIWHGLFPERAAVLARLREKQQGTH